jgi:mono/diheme cytochrome c family protein
MGLRRYIAPWLLGGARLTFGAALTIASAEPVFSAPDTYAQADPAVQAGMGVIVQARCGACHTIPGIPNAVGNFGPDLGPHDDVPPVSGRGMIATYPNGAVPNSSPDDLAAWIANAPSLKPTTAMPNLGLSPDDAAAAAAYLYAIQPDGSVAGLDSGSGAAGGGSPGSGG